MKRFLLPLVCVLAMGPLTHAQKAKTFFVPVAERNFAQNLGGYSELDYDWNEPDMNFGKKAGKALIAEKTYETFDLAYENLPVIPDVTEIDTREKLTDFLNIVRACDWARAEIEPREDVKAGGKRLADAQMENAKRAAKGLPYDTELHFDPKAKQYEAVMKKMATYYNPAYNESKNIVSPFSQSDPGYKDFILSNGLVGYKPVFQEFAPLRKQMCHEWFASPECKKIAEIEAGLMERVKAEGVRRAPDWFVQGRLAEQELVKAYNQRILKRWIQKVKPHLEKEKAIIPKMISYLREVDSVRGDDEMTTEYVGTQKQGDSYVRMFFSRYYAWLEFIGCAPLVKTPPTMEGKKL